MNQMIPLICLFAVAGLSPSMSEAAAQSIKTGCQPTLQDHLGPFYKPDAPARASVGKGYELSGMVKSSKDCSALDGAKIEIWMAGPDGRYDDKYRATLFSGEAGNYRVESHFPPSYGMRPPHIHIRVSAPGYQTLVTQHYPVAGRTKASFDLVLLPE